MPTSARATGLGGGVEGGCCARLKVDHDIRDINTEVPSCLSKFLEFLSKGGQRLDGENQ